MSDSPISPRARLKGALILLFAALIWGTTFVAQNKGMDNIEGFTFNGIRMLMGAFILTGYIAVRDSLSARNLTDPERETRRAVNRRSWKAGALIGLVLCVASNFQQFAFNHTTTGKIAFITALYMFFVPLFGLVLGRRPHPLVWLCVAAGFAGLYYLSIDPAEPLNINRGDLLALFCAMVYAVHILLVGHFAPETDGARVACGQFLVCGVLSCVLMLLFEHPTGGNIAAALPSLLYAGVMSCGIAFTLQVVGQKYAEPTVASLIMCMESVFGAVSAALILGDRMSGREILGCSLMFGAIVLSQLTDRIPLGRRRTGQASEAGKEGQEP